MKILAIVFGLLAAAALAAVLIAYICFRMAFYAPPRKTPDSDAIPIPEGKIYQAYREQMEDWVRKVRKLPCEDMSITSFDGLKLYGKFYEYAPGAPIELMIHGYRGNAERDLSGGVFRCFALGRSVLLVDQRCSGRSDGNVITFGIREHRDCLSWVDHLIRRFGPEVKIILTGVSMGASTVLLAGGTELPENVIGILADCGYHSTRDIICSVIRQMHLPPALGYPFVKLGARIFGRFDPDSLSPEEAVTHCRVPVIFLHGDADDFVPCYMSRINYEACASRKELVIIPGAGHGLCYPVAPETYLSALRGFFGPEASYREDCLC